MAGAVVRSAVPHSPVATTILHDSTTRANTKRTVSPPTPPPTAPFAATAAIVPTANTGTAAGGGVVAMAVPVAAASVSCLQSVAVMLCRLPSGREGTSPGLPPAVSTRASMLFVQLRGKILCRGRCASKKETQEGSKKKAIRRRKKASRHREKRECALRTTCSKTKVRSAPLVETRAGDRVVAGYGRVHRSPYLPSLPNAGATLPRKRTLRSCNGTRHGRLPCRPLRPAEPKPLQRPPTLDHRRPELPVDVRLQ